MDVRILEIFRHAMTAAGGIFVYLGYMDETTVQTMIGAILTVVAVGWGVYSHRGEFVPVEDEPEIDDHA